MKNILVVDDEADILETIVDSLEIEFEDLITVHTAGNGNEALVLFNEETHYSLVITDLNMPDMNGLELTENIKKIKNETPIIVFTGHGDVEEKEALHSLGVAAMIKKPYVEDLIEAVAKVIN